MFKQAFFLIPLLAILEDIATKRGEALAGT